MNTILKADSTFDSSAHNLVYVKLYINKFHVFTPSVNSAPLEPNYYQPRIRSDNRRKHRSIPRLP